jgi:hypothetical protein
MIDIVKGSRPNRFPGNSVTATQRRNVTDISMVTNTLHCWNPDNGCWTGNRPTAMQCKSITDVSEATISLQCKMNGDTRCSLSGPHMSTLRQGFQRRVECGRQTGCGRNCQSTRECSRRSPVEESARRSQSQILIEYRELKSNNSRVSYSPVSEEERHKKLYASVQGEETSTDCPDTRHQGVRIECNERM